MLDLKTESMEGLVADQSISADTWLVGEDIATAGTESTSQPLKVTLAWTDAAGPTSADPVIDFGFSDGSVRSESDSDAYAGGTAASGQTYDLTVKILNTLSAGDADAFLDDLYSFDGNQTRGGEDINLGVGELQECTISKAADRDAGTAGASNSNLYFTNDYSLTVLSDQGFFLV
jgi:hypothetical protein